MPETRVEPQSRETFTPGGSVNQVDMSNRPLNQVDMLNRVSNRIELLGLLVACGL